MKKLIGMLVLVLSLAGSVATASTASASITVTVSGTVQCTGGQPVQGIWVQSSAGGSKFASWYAYPGLTWSAKYSATLTMGGTSTVSLHVGCGGTRSAWRSTVLSPGASVSRSRILNAHCDASRTGRYVGCSFPPKGQTVTYNQGAAGYCTWGAYDQWRRATGYYPNIGGHATQMDENAAAKGWRVSRAPHKRAMVVFNATTTGGYGHVGWVTEVSKNSAGQIVISYIDMNGGTFIQGTDAKTTDFNRFVARTKVWTSSVNWRFIVATA